MPSSKAGAPSSLLTFQGTFVRMKPLRQQLLPQVHPLVRLKSRSKKAGLLQAQTRMIPQSLSCMPDMVCGLPLCSHMSGMPGPLAFAELELMCEDQHPESIASWEVPLPHLNHAEMVFSTFLLQPA